MTMLSWLFAGLFATPTAVPRADPIIRWEAPTSYVAGQAYDVQVEIDAPEGGTVVASWLLSPAAFLIDGQPLGQRADKGALELPPGFKVSGKINLGPYLGERQTFKLSYAGAGDPVEVTTLQLAPAGLDFMTMPVEELASYRVLLVTNRGEILLKLWPDVAPNHVRNFLDLAYAKFYDGTTFHRVIKEFMIQGGDPTGSGSGTGKRKLTLETSTRPHLRGVLSMARTQAPDGASCQFFVVHKDSRHLDGQYTAFGEVLSGMDTVDRVATTAVGERSKPLEEQTLVKALVIKAQG